MLCCFCVFHLIAMEKTQENFALSGFLSQDKWGATALHWAAASNLGRGLSFSRFSQKCGKLQQKLAGCLTTES
jgi:hypothetical protein